MQESYEMATTLESYTSDSNDNITVDSKLEQ
jgi:hypothetical protein